MILDWEQKIRDVCERLGVEPELYNDDDEFREWMARFFGFKSYEDFVALPEPKDIVNGLALEMPHNHLSWQYAMSIDCVFLLEHNLELYNDVERTEKEITNFLGYATTNFTKEIQLLSLFNIRNIRNDKFQNILSTHETFIKTANKIENKD